MKTNLPIHISAALAFIFLLLLTLLNAATASAAPASTSFAPDGNGHQYTNRTNGKETALPSISAQYMDQVGIELDGKLDEAIWDMAETGNGFRQHDPDRGVPASVPTTFKILYDDEALYIGMACWEDDMSNVTSSLSRRDQIEASDLVSIYIDPYHDKTTGYNFRVTPLGVQQDAYIYDNGRRDQDWNAVWSSEVSSDAKGWYVEIRIPFSAIRFKPADDMTWGLQVYRWLHGRGEDTGWVLWDRNLNGFVNRWGTLEGLHGVDNPRKLEALPYVMTRSKDPAAEGEADQWNHFQNMGADFKYGITSNLTLNATIQPDFGQVEADPATLNLSPFETYFQEKRPFFVEGARFFKHPDFNLFYSRRIGTGDPNARIRAATKLTGKIAGDVSIAVLGAATDYGVPGKVHNPFVVGNHKATYLLARMGKEFNDGNHQINAMGTFVNRDPDSFDSSSWERDHRNAETYGLDGEMNFKDRMYRVKGSVVSTLTKPHDGSASSYGSGGRVGFNKLGGTWRYGLGGSWESDQLDPNDMGYLSAPDEITTYANLEYEYNSDGKDALFNRANFQFDAHSSWLYAGNSGHDITTGDVAWQYDEHHRQYSGYHASTWGQLSSFHQGWVWFGRANEGTDKYATWDFNDEPGPLMTRPGWYAIAMGGTTDWRKPLSLHLEGSYDWGDENMSNYGGSGYLRWNANQHLSLSLGLGARSNHTESQWIGNFANDGLQENVTGIGGVDYVFGTLDQSTIDMTFRANILINRDQSIQLYAQPYATTGDYTDPLWLAEVDSYDLRPYSMDASQRDFQYTSINLNLVYRYEYRPGSTIYLVWAHGKSRYDQRSGAANPHSWDNRMDFSDPFKTEPENTFMAKVSYWFSI
jgi:hypothetical protein